MRPCRVRTKPAGWAPTASSARTRTLSPPVSSAGSNSPARSYSGTAGGVLLDEIVGEDRLEIPVVGDRQNLLVDGLVAAGGKVASCTVLSDSAPGKGFDKAALCVASAMPIGDKSGEVKIPMRFPGGA